MSNDQKSRIGDPELWIRLLYMIVFALLSGLARLLICAIALLQFLAVLISGADNRALRDFSASLTDWVWLCFRFITFDSEEKPFPFADWPAPGATAAQPPSHSDETPSGS